LAFPPTTVQVTAVLDVPVTVAEKSCELPARTEGLPGETLTAMVADGEPLLPADVAHPLRKSALIQNVRKARWFSTEPPRDLTAELGLALQPHSRKKVAPQRD
jgi:hypothetical protein